MSDERHLLAIETSSQAASVAIISEDRVVGERSWLSGQSHTTSLLPAIKDLCATAHVPMASLSAIGTAVGPGAFTALRIGVGTAKALAWSLGIPCVGVGSLDVIAYSCAVRSGKMCAVIEAGRGDWYAAKFQMAEYRLRRVGTPFIGTSTMIRGEMDAATLLCTENAAAAKRFQASGAVLLTPQNIGATLPRAGYLARLAWEAWRAGDVTPLLELQPRYLRRSAAEERA
jgi:tRNA threonylcarbamoyladenosine biosynthesis protein TsaB